MKAEMLIGVALGLSAMAWALGAPEPAPSHLAPARNYVRSDGIVCERDTGQGWFCRHVVDGSLHIVSLPR